MRQEAWDNRALEQDKYTPKLSKPIYKNVYNKAMRTLDEGFGTDLTKLKYTDVKFQTLSKLRHDTAKFFGHKHLAFDRQAQKLAHTYSGDQTTFKRKFHTLYRYRFERQFQTELGAVDLAGQSAKSWLEIQESKADYPNLRYDAVNDGRTRAEHRGWDGIILPIDHPFWKTHFPPNGWKCRCIVVQTDEAVTYTNSSGKLTDPDNPPAFKEGDKPFSNNPALSGKVFNGSKYFREAGENDFREVRRKNIWVTMDSIRNSIPNDESLKAINKETERLIQLNRGAVKKVFSHDAYGEKALIYQILYDFKHLANTMRELQKDEADGENKHGDKITSWDYYRVKFMGKEFQVDVAKQGSGNRVMYAFKTLDKEKWAKQIPD